jgi:hypothetical protein
MSIFSAISDAKSLFGSKSKSTGTNYGTTFNSTLESWKMGVGNQYDTTFYGETFRTKLKSLEQATGIIPFGVNANTQTSTINKFMGSTSGGGIPSSIGGIPTKMIAIGLAALAAVYYFMSKKKKR